MSYPEAYPETYVAPPRERNALDLVATIVGLVLTALIGLGCSFMGLLLVMGSDSCGASSDCSDDLIGLGVLIGVAGPFLVWIPALIVVIIQQTRRRLTWWIPLVALLGFAVTMALAFFVVDLGVTPR